MDLVREILLKIEQYNPKEHGGRATFRLQISDFPPRFHSLNTDDLFFHLDMMYKEGLLPVEVSPSPSGSVAGWLSLKGYQYLEEIRDPYLFAKLLKRLNPKHPYPLEYVRKIARQIQQSHDQLIASCVIGTIAFVAGCIATWIAGWFW